MGEAGLGCGPWFGSGGRWLKSQGLLGGGGEVSWKGGRPHRGGRIVATAGSGVETVED